MKKQITILLLLCSFFCKGQRNSSYGDGSLSRENYFKWLEKDIAYLDSLYIMDDSIFVSQIKWHGVAYRKYDTLHLSGDSVVNEKIDFRYPLIVVDKVITVGASYDTLLPKKKPIKKPKKY